MKYNVKTSLLSLATISILTLSGCGNGTDNPSENNETENNATHSTQVSDEVIAAQREALANSLNGSEGAQAPRDIDSKTGKNTIDTITAPPFSEMNLCDIHFHKSAEHKGGEFTTYAGNGNGEGYGSGYKYSGTLTAAELAHAEIPDAHNPLYSGDTIEVHYAYASNPSATLGNGLGTCLTGASEGIQPLLRVETQVYVLVNDKTALDFVHLTAITGDGTVGNFHQAPYIPSDTGKAVQYEGSTTGPDYNEKASPYQVTWNVRPKIAKVNITTVKTWLEDNVFDEDHAHPVRNLVINPLLLSPIE